MGNSLEVSCFTYLGGFEAIILKTKTLTMVIVYMMAILKNIIDLKPAVPAIKRNKMAKLTLKTMYWQGTAGRQVCAVSGGYLWLTYAKQVQKRDSVFRVDCSCDG